jgi:hypothetical protein
MGLIGFVDPSHDERKKDEPGRRPKWIPRDELLDRFATAPPKYSPWTWELVAAALDQWQDRDYISTTMLLGCGRSKVLERKEDFILSLDDLWPAFKGTQTHRTLEFFNRPDSLAEARFWTSFRIPGVKDKVEVSCSPDLVTARPVAVVDYKAPVDDRSIPTYGYPWHSHTQQLQFNRYIVNHAERWELREGDELPWNPRELRFEHLYIVYIGSRWPKVIEVQRKETVPMKSRPGELKEIKVPDIWSNEVVEEEMHERLTGMVKALAAYPDWPEGLEDFPGFEGPPGWQCPGKPWCKLPDCLAKRYPNGLTWEQPPARRRRATA